MSSACKFIFIKKSNLLSYERFRPRTGFKHRYRVTHKCLIIKDDDSVGYSIHAQGWLIIMSPHNQVRYSTKANELWLTSIRYNKAWLWKTLLVETWTFVVKAFQSKAVNKIIISLALQLYILKCQMFFS